MSPRIQAVVFDIDGTLLDSVDLHARAWVEAFAHFGIEAKEAEVRRQIGKGGDQLLPVFVDAERLAREGEAIESYRSDLFKRSYLAQAKPFPAVQALLSHVRDAGQTVALASSGKADEVENYQRILGITDLVDVVTTSDDAERSKPHPDIFEAVLGKLPGVPKQAVMVVGDTPYDAQASARAGLSTIGVLCGGFPEAELSEAGCVAIYRDPQDLLDGYACSPLA
ncbi:MAG TPA: HAD family hydrolase [Methylobacterium sp.]|jgi:HAD superfamily hydrolase (TIGR01549 family)|uniref:HAD family hydrolase n=1 Tax=Methylorubrum sp. B1-46 TaxID=2897334 RepID=UPI001E533A73|nr:HAD family hydrolase [Methylorubrum sp. B1-46]UGB25235.1 HAD family hydrolase [Methylorubrum sp. B1-46]HEV2545405.1 HAD family hydrolase [Methylobacterium sp.]